MYWLTHRPLKAIVPMVYVLLMSSCERPETTIAYYNIDSLLQEQILYLKNAGAVLHKQAEIRGVTQDTTYTPSDSTTWANELDLFAEISTMNKPINVGGYDVSDGEADPHSNLTIRTLTANKPMSIVYLKTFYQDSPDKLRKLEALYHQENALLKSQRKLIMEFSDIYNKSILTSYLVEGGQKMFVGDTVYFTIKGTVHLK
jgi:hypothetical protein